MNDIEAGTEAIPFLCSWVSARAEVAAIKLFKVRQTPLLLTDQVSSEDAVILKRALVLKETLDLPFWDAVMLFASQEPLGSQTLFDRLMLHNPSNSGVVQIKRSDLNPSCIKPLLDELAEDELLVLSSKVLTIGGGDGYIPMLDFHRKADDFGISLVRRVVHAMNMSGFVLASGKSYHFYGDKLMSAEEQRIFLAEALLFGSIVDRAWIAHQLIEGESGLRLSMRPDYGTAPFVIDRVAKRSR